jgi:8-oxo-dGTP diphosphatase
MRMRPRIKVVGAAIVRDGKCLVAQRGAGMREALKWEFPGGKIEPGEQPEAALAREILEELDVAIVVERFVAAAVVGAIELSVYRATISGPAEPAAREHARLAWLDAAGLRDLEWAAADVPIVPAVIALIANG